MDRYFGCYTMSEAMQFSFAKERPLHEGKDKWRYIESLRDIRWQRPIDTWYDMKIQLRKTYLAHLVTSS